ncbi:hypothetical protein G5V59_02170 [Nocardioides sp. W3-2-3]|uniref:SPFH domain-containing protein n=1 Tax=Nocardioides convexus TaxID=2712224 RepID=UPI003101A94D|nr:hypothetical protein [Nocardioides convexus]
MPRARGRRTRSWTCASRLTALAPQEVPTDDGLSVKISATVRWRVADPVSYAEVATDAVAVVYLAVQVAVRETRGRPRRRGRRHRGPCRGHRPAARGRACRGCPGRHGGAGHGRQGRAAAVRACARRARTWSWPGTGRR